MLGDLKNLPIRASEVLPTTGFLVPTALTQELDALLHQLGYGGVKVAHIKPDLHLIAEELEDRVRSLRSKQGELPSSREIQNRELVLRHPAPQSQNPLEELSHPPHVSGLHSDPVNALYIHRGASRTESITDFSPLQALQKGLADRTAPAGAGVPSRPSFVGTVAPLGDVVDRPLGQPVVEKRVEVANILP